MMNIKLNAGLLLIASLLAFSANVSAQTGGGLTTAGTIESLNAADLVQIRGTFANDPDGCGDTDAYILQGDNANFNSIYAGLLTAFAAGREVRLFVRDCVTSPNGARTRPIVESVLIQ